jgi:hypothetical protein
VLPHFVEEHAFPSTSPAEEPMGGTSTTAIRDGIRSLWQ